ncbi:type VI secretion system protein ImpK [Variovorax sp. OAS795]|uniref:DotU family type IV/VI secretion system protein n=1 Tax=Variovorax sp. OAS795 TaxID=3034231 RepID=UPI003393970C
MRLVDCFIPALAVVRQFADAPADDAPVLAARLQPLLATAQHDGLALGASEEDVRSALFAVSAWVDEALLTCNWPAAEAWQRLLLQRQFFGVSNAGVAFFQRLAELGDGRADVAEVYVLCLSLGFKGRFGHGGDARELADIRLRAMRRVLAHASANGVSEAETLVFPGAKPAEPARGAAVRRSRWMPSRLSVAVLSISVLTLLVLYLVFFSILRQQVHAILPLIR